LARAVTRLFPRRSIPRLFHNEIIPDGFDPIDAPCDLACAIDGLLRINEAAQLSDALAGLDADLERLEKVIGRELGFDFGGDDRIVDVIPRALLFGCRGTGRRADDQNQNQKTADNYISRFHGGCSLLSFYGDRMGYTTFFLNSL